MMKFGGRVSVFFLSIFVFASNIFGESDSLKTNYSKSPAIDITSIRDDFDKTLINEGYKNYSVFILPSGTYCKSIYLAINPSLEVLDIKVIAIFSEGFDMSQEPLKAMNDSLYIGKVGLSSRNGFPVEPISIVFDRKNNSIFYKCSNPSGKNEPYYFKRENIGSYFPFKRMNTCDGKDIEITRDKIFIFNWWETGCVPCRVEIPGLNKLVEKYKGNDSVVFISVIHDNNNLKKFLSGNRFDYIHCFSDKDITDYFGIRYPRNIIVNHEGKVIYDEVGAIANKYIELEKVIDQAISIKK
ncbi:MAG TPA: TlpA disulfide reductase family protein [Ignavibacteriales bacterium]|nr:TlpA disulfide reductase family protein [Ignavibacteriales bacterium]